MSTVRLKRKHVLDSDSDEDEADAPAASVAEVREREASDVKARLAAIAAKAAEDASASAPAPRKRLASAADREAERAAAAAHTSTTDPALEVVTLDDDSDGDSDAGDEDGTRRSVDAPRFRVDSVARSAKTSGAATARSPGSAAKPGTLTSKRHLVTVDDVAAVAGEGSLAPNLKPYQLIGINFLLLLDEQDVPGPSSQTRWASARRRRPSPTSPTVATASPRRGRMVRRRRGRCGCPRNPRWSSRPAVVGKLAEELERWAPSLRVGFFPAPPRRRRRATGRTRGRGRAGTVEPPLGWRFRRNHACYSLFERDSAEQKTHRQWLRTLNYSHLVLDEAHLVKNRATQRASAWTRWRPRRGGEVLLTGQPLQNNLLELESLIHLVLPVYSRRARSRTTARRVFPRRRARRTRRRARRG